MSQPKSVVFDEAPPAHAFQHVFFHASVKLVDDHKRTVSGHAQTLQVTLRYHDTYDIVADQSLLEVDPMHTTVDAATGRCRLRLQLTALTAAHEGRAFCLEVGAREHPLSEDPTARSLVTARTLSSAFSSAIHVVKEKLVITEQPPEVWFKDEGGREKCMVVVLVLQPAPGASLESRVVPLQLRLLYESGAVVLNQKILRLFPDMRPNMSRGRIAISFRIDDVSKNHQGQSFVLEVAPEKQAATSQMFQDIAPARTSVIAIRSKRNKRKLNNGGGVSTTTTSSSSSSSSTTTMARNGNTMPASASMTAMPPHGARSRGSRASGARGGGGGGSVMMAPSPTHGGPTPVPSPAQRARHMNGTTMGPTATTPVNNNNQYAVTPQRVGMQMTPSWSSYVQQQQLHEPQQQQQQQQHHRFQQQSMTTSTHGFGPSASAENVEWKLAGFEIHADGSVNSARPIYRCKHCQRLVDTDRMAQGHALHDPQCLLVASNGSHAGGAATTPTAATADNVGLSMGMGMRMGMAIGRDHSHGNGHGAPGSAGGILHRSQLEGAGVMQQNAQYYPHGSTQAMLPDHTHTPQYLFPQQQQQQQQQQVPPTQGQSQARGASPTNMQRPGLTISPFMDKLVAAEASSSSGPEDTVASSVLDEASENLDHSSTNNDADHAGNLFASNAFRTQMGLGAGDPLMASFMGDDKLSFLNGNVTEEKLSAVLIASAASSAAAASSGTSSTSSSSSRSSSSMILPTSCTGPFSSAMHESSTSPSSLVVSVDNNQSLFSDMSGMSSGFESSSTSANSTTCNMAASLYTKAPTTYSGASFMDASFDDFAQGGAGDLFGPQGPLDDDGGNDEEAQVFFILARMYSNMAGGKLGLPAFDQFQRMLGFYAESQEEAQTQVLFHPLAEFELGEKEQEDITKHFVDELQRRSDAVHALPKYQHNLVLLREDALMYYWSQSIQCFT